MQDDISAVKQKNKDLTTTVNETDKALAFMNEDVEELKTQEKRHKIETEKLDEKIRYMEAYQRRENLRFNGISENAAEEDTREVIYKFLENQLGIDWREKQSSNAFTEQERRSKVRQGLLLFASCVFRIENWFTVERQRREIPQEQFTCLPIYQRKSVKVERSYGLTLGKQGRKGKQPFLVAQSQINS